MIVFKVVKIKFSKGNSMNRKNKKWIIYNDIKMTVVDMT